MLTTMSTAFVLAVAVALRAADGWYYRDSDRVLRTIGLLPRGDGPTGTRQPLDPLFAVFPMVWPWCDLVVALLLARRVDHWAAYLALAVFAGGRFRLLQEVGHTAVHSGLCRSRRWQWGLADVLIHAPLFRADTAHRFEAHVRQHHWHVNELDEDPNVARFVRLGFVPGIPAARYRSLVFHPFTPRGLAETVWVTVTNAAKNSGTGAAVARAAMVAATAGAVAALGGWEGLVAGYAIPLFTVYPFFSWISLLVEHRWFVACDDTDRRRRECILGRPTEYPGFVGWVLSRAMFPASDRFHLAHSLYPALRWNHLAAVDRALRTTDDAYARFGSVGLVVARSGAPASAMSELKDRMTGHRDDVAPWAVGLTGRGTHAPVHR